MNTDIPNLDLHDAIGHLYDSALDPAVWPTALEAMCRLVGGCNSGIAVHDTVRRETRLATEWSGGDIQSDWPKWRTLFDEKYAALMPFYDLLPRCEIGEVLNTEMMACRIGLGNVYDHPFFAQWALPAGLRDNIATVVMKTPNRLGTLTIHTSTKRELVGPRQLAIAALLAPHVRRAVTIGDLLETTASRAVTLQATLDTMSAAVVVTDAQARVVLCNAAGDAMLGNGEPLGTENGQLRARQSPATQALRIAISRSDDPVRKLASDGIGVPLQSSDGTPAIAHILPLEQGRPQRDWGPRATAAVFVAPVDYALPSAEALAALYGLTGMEARVLMQIADGRNRTETAATLGIADSTVKTHLDRIFSKTGTGNQAALAKLVAGLASPTRR